MPSLRKVPGSPYFIAAFRDGKGRQYNRSTRQTNRNMALTVALEFERMARGWVAENNTVASVYKLASDLGERIGKPIAAPTVRAEFQAFTDGLGAKSGRTQERYRQVCREFLTALGKRAEVNLFALSTPDIEHFRDSRLAEGIAPQGVGFELKVIRSVLGRAMKAGRIPKNPAVDVDAPEGKAQQREIFELEHVQALLTACERHKRGRDWRGAVLMGFYTGARLSDIAGMKWSNVDFAKRELFFTPQKTKRRGTQLHVPLHPDLEAHLLGLSAPDVTDAPLFPTLAARGTGGAHGLSSEFVGLMTDAGIERRILRAGEGKKGRAVHDLGAHSFRHSLSTHLARAGVAEDVRMLLVGHESKEIHRLYADKGLTGKMRSAVEMLPKVSAGSQTVAGAVLEQDER